MRQQPAVEAIRERQFFVVYYRGEPLVRVRSPAASKSVVQELAHREDERVQR